MLLSATDVPGLLETFAADGAPHEVAIDAFVAFVSKTTERGGARRPDNQLKVDGGTSSSSTRAASSGAGSDSDTPVGGTTRRRARRRRARRPSSVSYSKYKCYIIGAYEIPLFMDSIVY